MWLGSLLGFRVVSGRHVRRTAPFSIRVRHMSDIVQPNQALLLKNMGTAIRVTNTVAIASLSRIMQWTVRAMAGSKT